MKTWIRLFALMMIIGAVAETAAVESGPGEADCDSMADSSGCKVAWNLSASARSYYRLQRYRLANGRWQSIGGPLGGAYGVTENKIRDGGLHRVAGCNDAAMTVDCVYSTVFWVPVQRAPSSLPPAMVLKYADGSPSEVAYLSLDTSDPAPALVQYNIYFMMNLAYELGVNLPPMSEPSHPTDSTLATFAHIIRDNVYLQYSELKRRPEGMQQDGVP